MIRLVRILMTLLIGRLLAWGPIAAAWDEWGPKIGLTRDTLYDWATVFGIGLVVTGTEMLKRSDKTAKFLNFFNRILSAGLSNSDPSYATGPQTMVRVDVIENPEGEHEVVEAAIHNLEVNPNEPHPLDNPPVDPAN